MSKVELFSQTKATSLTLRNLKNIFAKKGVGKVYYKVLAPNDNSKNQIYVASHLDELKFLPDGNLTAEQTSSSKKASFKTRFLYSFPLKWLNFDNESIPAPKAKMIYYPQYPEVRFSGFLQGAKVNSDGWFDPYQKGRSHGRILFMGASNNTLYCWLSVTGSAISEELLKQNHEIDCGVLSSFSTSKSVRKNSKTLLLKELKRIHEKGWIKSKKLGKERFPVPYKAKNGGGYTLEAELDISANSYANPDFVDWEVKQFGVKNFNSNSSKAITLMTPEPDGGIYTNPGFLFFMKEFGYPDSKIDNRLNFNGKHLYGKLNDKTNLLLTLKGYDLGEMTISSSDGYIGLISEKGELAASWSFTKMLKHWKNKHSKAAYIPSILGKTGSEIYYKYGNLVQLYEGTDFNQFLSALINFNVYYDPGCKLENINSEHPKAKKRSQFRVTSKELAALYKNWQTVDLLQ